MYKAWFVYTGWYLRLGCALVLRTLISFSHLLHIDSNVKSKIYFPKKTVFISTCATWSELPSNIITMAKTHWILNCWRLNNVLWIRIKKRITIDLNKYCSISHVSVGQCFLCLIFSLSTNIWCHSKLLRNQITISV